MFAVGLAPVFHQIFDVWRMILLVLSQVFFGAFLAPAFIKRDGFKMTARTCLHTVVYNAANREIINGSGIYRRKYAV